MAPTSKEGLRANCGARVPRAGGFFRTSDQTPAKPQDEQAATKVTDNCDEQLRIKN
jgi:hypothetical protein